ncbi:hypothetical protein BJY59DRAFT_223546 [Rhodotorula toruloides]
MPHSRLRRSLPLPSLPYFLPPPAQEMATPEALLLLAATTFVAGVIAHMVWQARGWAATRPRGSGREAQHNEQEEDGAQLDSLSPPANFSSTSQTHHPSSPSTPHTRPRHRRHDEPANQLGSSLLLSPPPAPPLPPLPPPSPSTSMTSTCPEWISQAGATDSWSEAVTGLEEEARDVW